MITRGEYSTKKQNFGVLVNHIGNHMEIQLYEMGVIYSAYMVHDGKEYQFKKSNAKDLYAIIKKAMGISNKKNTTAMPFVYGVSTVSEKETKTESIKVEKFDGNLVGLQFKSEKAKVSLEFYTNNGSMPELGYIELTNQNDNFDLAEDSLDAVKVRTVAEIAMEKESVEWLKNKKYYIVNDEEQAERLFQYLDNYKGVIAYDTETTGLRINCFGKIGSKYKKSLEEYNSKVASDERIRADELVGIIFCVEKDVSYYFPVKNRKFKNLYEIRDRKGNKGIIEATKNNILARYTLGDMRNEQGDMAQFIRSTPTNEWTPDIILMERVRNILSTRHLVAHNGSFEYKVGLLYDIDTNIKDDTMIMHQLMYKFRTTTSNRGEPSNLKYLSKVELGIDQWELSDFFPDISKKDDGLIRKKKGQKNKGLKIDFSYMDYAGSQVYAPADGDCTFQLFIKYKMDLMENNKELEYLYNVEVIVSSAIAYMEFYGLRIDEDKITYTRDITGAQVACIISEIRQKIGYASDMELQAYDKVKEAVKLTEAGNHSDREELKRLTENLNKAVEDLNNITSETGEHELNLASPAQVADLFYNILGIECPDGSMSVGKKTIKPLLKMKNENGEDTYPVVKMYAKYKDLSTLMTKFFDNLPYFMYPGGFIFPSYGQIATATGRMTSNKPNAQQFPKSITKIVIPRDGYIMTDADYSQIEYRVMVAMSKEKNLLGLFSDPDSDFHTLMASRMYGVDYASVTPKMRSDAKSFNFGIPYGMGFGSLAILLTGRNTPKTREEAKEKYEMYFKDQPKVRKFFEDVKEMASVNKYTKTLWNRRRDYSFTDKNGKESNSAKAQALRQAGNAVIQGTAADIFKISVARNFQYIRKNKLFGDFLIVNMVHDEQLMEINYKKLNVQRVLRDIGHNMQFQLEDFPPLYIGAGIGKSWNDAKGKMAEIHPMLLKQLSDEAENMEIRTENSVDGEQLYEYFHNRVYNFRLNKIKDYIENPDNFGKALHPAIGNLLNLQFASLSEDEAKSKGMSDGEYLKYNLERFIENFGINSSAEKFLFNDIVKHEEEEETAYDDGDDTDDGEYDEYDESSFRILDTQDDIHGISIQDIIAQFGYTVSLKNKICGIDVRGKSESSIENIVSYLAEYICEEDEEEAVQIVFLATGNVLNRTGVYVKNISLEGLDRVLNGKQTK